MSAGLKPADIVKRCTVHRKNVVREPYPLKDIRRQVLKPADMNICAILPSGRFKAGPAG